MKAGDSVLYVPHQVHARQRDRNGAHPWVFGWKSGKKVKDRHGRQVDEIDELTHGEASLKMRHIRKQAPHRQETEANKLVFIRPNVCWEALVKAVRTVNGKEVADLDIQDATTGATLHYDGVPVDETGKLPDTCHSKPQVHKDQAIAPVHSSVMVEAE